MCRAVFISVNKVKGLCNLSLTDRGYIKQAEKTKATFRTLMCGRGLGGCLSSRIAAKVTMARQGTPWQNLHVMANLYLIKLLQEITEQIVNTATAPQEKGGLGFQCQYIPMCV